MAKQKSIKKDFFEGNLNLPKTEEKVLEFWKTNQIFEKTQIARAKGKRYVFFEGPPSANGRPGLHHIISRVFKDIILRYKTMEGYSIPRKSGWDTHGLPVEITAEKQLGLKNKKEIEKYGVAAFNKKCRELVWEYKDEWEKFTDRIGFWLDLKDPYITYDNDYIESLWWILKRISEKGYLYKGHKIVNWCTRCGTGLSSHELGQPGAYREVMDQSVYVKFKLNKGQKIGNHHTDSKTYILSWTTTPWTLPGNLALAVGADIDYVLIKMDGEFFILAEERLKDVIKERSEVIGKFKGSTLLDLRYEPLFEVKELQTEKSYRVYPASFVTTTDGTGVVHTAVMYGEDDFKLGTSIGLPEYHTVEEDGRFRPNIPVVAGMYVKSKETEQKIFDYLKEKNFLLRTEEYVHEYPHCWRCGTPLLYYARSSWFISVNKVRKEMIANNKEINWIPAHIKNGRFGEWLKEEKDWNLSRERYWATPLPVWECSKCKKISVIGGVEELSEKADKPRNKYWAMRHGFSESNLLSVIDSGQGVYHLTSKGERQINLSAKTLLRELKQKGQKIDIMISSPIYRTKETAEIAAKILGVEKIITDDRLKEIALGPDFTGKPARLYNEAFPLYRDRFEKEPLNGESLVDLRKRLWEFLKETDEKYAGKNILLVTHEYPMWMLSHIAKGWDEKRSIIEKGKMGEEFAKNGEVMNVTWKTIPRDETGEADLHRPYVDDIVLDCECGGKMKRAKEVIDVWFDSGAMPYAEWHYPFQNKDFIDKKKMFPADYICEAVDQTRGWFYTLLAESTLLHLGPAYKNVICLGHINDKFGQKMSKSKGNVIDPWEMINKYGIDAVRWYMYTSTPPGEPKNFDPEEVLKVTRKFQGIVYNSYVFYETYADRSTGSSRAGLRSGNLLDKWILSRMAETEVKVTDSLKKYMVREAGLAIEELTDDLSRWYIRRSRRRFQKPESKKDFAAASFVLGDVLLRITKLIAPFTPFFAEALYHGLDPKGEKERSIHLVRWVKPNKRAVNAKLNKAMAEARRVSSLGLAKRAELGIKVRQPLNSLSVKNMRSDIKGKKDLLNIVKEEVNVKKILFNSKIKEEVELDTFITPELKEEGMIRELVRAVQDLRQDAGCKPKDKIILFIDLPEAADQTIRNNEEKLIFEVNAKKIEYKKMTKLGAESTIKIEDKEGWIGLKKV